MRQARGCNFRANSYSVKTKLTGLLCCLFMLSACAQNETGFTNICRGVGAYSTRHTDVFSFLANPASLTQTKHTAAGISSARKFMLSELGDYAIAGNLHAGPGTFGLALLYTGDAAYKEMQAGLAYGRKLGTGISLGVQLNYSSTGVAAGYGKYSAMHGAVGLIMHITPQLHAGIHVSGLSAPGKNKQTVQPSPSFKIGAGFEPSSGLLITATINKKMYEPVHMSAAVQYLPVKRLLIRLGLESQTASWFTGAGFYKGNIRIDVFAYYHPQLGFTPGMSLIFQKDKQTK